MGKRKERYYKKKVGSFKKTTRSYKKTRINKTESHTAELPADSQGMRETDTLPQCSETSDGPLVGLQSVLTKIFESHFGANIKNETGNSSNGNTNPVPENTPEVIKVFCPKCKSEVSHTAEGIQMDQKDQLIAKVYHYFEQEYEELKRTIPGIEQSALAQLRQRTARATGVSETAVADVLAEEARRNEVRVKEEKRRSKEPLLVERKTRIRSMQDESSGEECNYYSSDEDNDDRFEATETLVIKEEPLEPEYEDPAEPAFLNLPSVKEEPASSEDPKELVDPIAINIKKEPGVKTEPNEEEATTSNGLTGATTSIKKRKIKTEAPPATSSSPTTSSTPKRRLVQIKDIKVKVEKEEIKEEGDS